MTNGPFRRQLCMEYELQSSVDAGTGVSPGYAYEGMWGGQLLRRPAADAEDDEGNPIIVPVAGTFSVRQPTTWVREGVTRTMTSPGAWIGAFGAQKEVEVRAGRLRPRGFNWPRGPGRMKESEKGVARWLLPS